MFAAGPLGLVTGQMVYEQRRYSRKLPAASALFIYTELLATISAPGLPRRDHNWRLQGRPANAPLRHISHESPQAIHGKCGEGELGVI